MHPPRDAQAGFAGLRAEYVRVVVVDLLEAVVAAAVHLQLELMVPVRYVQGKTRKITIKRGMDADTCDCCTPTRTISTHKTNPFSKAPFKQSTKHTHTYIYI